jgi:uncharacterized membrane protein
MKYAQLLIIVFLTACNQSSESDKAKADTTSADGTLAAIKTDTASDMLKVSAIGSNEYWQQKKQAGFSWIGTGTEPFWNIERKNGSIYFQLSEWPKPRALIATRKINSTDSVVYLAKNDSMLIEAVIKEEKCSDGMSDRVYDHSIKVEFNKTLYKGCAVVF